MAETKRKGILLQALSAFALTFAAVLAIFMLQGVFTQGRSLLVSDGYVQYYQLTLYYKQILSGARSSVYTFSTGTGMGVLPTVAYYLMSPFNLFYIFIPDGSVQLWMHIFIMIKIALAAMTMYILLASEHDRTPAVLLLAFSFMYALCGWAVGYCYEVIWTDHLYLLPLVTLGLNRLVAGKSPWLYVCSVFMAIMCSYYLGYMFCIFSLLYFIVRVHTHTENAKERGERWMTFLLSSLGAGLSTMFIMWPTVRSMASDSGRMAKSLPFRIDFFGPEALSKIFFATSDPDYINMTNGYLYHGISTVILSGAYFFNPAVPASERKWNGLLFGILYLSLIFAPLYYIWHALTIPSCLAGRFTFIVSFVSVLLAVQSFDKRRKAPVYAYLIPAGVLTLLGVIYAIRPVDYVSWISIGATVLFAWIYAFLFSRPGKMPQAVILVMAAIMIIESFINGAAMLKAWDKEDFRIINTYNERKKQELSVIQDDSFYRVADGAAYSSLESMNSGYNGSTTFLSSLTNSFPTVANLLGYPDRLNSYWYSDDATEITDIFLDHKYVISDGSRNMYETVSQYTIEAGHNGLQLQNPDRTRLIQRNDMVFGIGAMTVSAEAEPFDENENTLDYQNRLFKAMTGLDEDVLRTVPMNASADNTWTYTADENSDYYLYARTDRKFNYLIKVWLNGKMIRSYDTECNPLMLNYVHLSRAQGNCELKIEMDENTVWHDDPKLYVLDAEVLNKGVRILQSRSFKLTELSEGGILKGTAGASAQAPYLYLSIPYERGFSALVDGQPAEIIRMYNGMTGIEMTPGEHTVELRFSVIAKNQGLILCAIGILCLIVTFLLGDRLAKRTGRFFASHEKMLHRLSISSVALVLAGVYAVDFLYGYNRAWRPVMIALPLLAAGTYALFRFRRKNTI